MTTSNESNVNIIEPHSKAFALSNDSAIVANFDRATEHTDPSIVILMSALTVEVSGVPGLLQLQKAVEFALYGPKD